jgi:hypothetical protein
MAFDITRDRTQVSMSQVDTIDSVAWQRCFEELNASRLQGGWQSGFEVID